MGRFPRRKKGETLARGLALGRFFMGEGGLVGEVSQRKGRSFAEGRGKVRAAGRGVWEWDAFLGDKKGKRCPGTWSRDGFFMGERGRWGVAERGMGRWGRIERASLEGGQAGFAGISGGCVRNGGGWGEWGKTRACGSGGSLV